MKKTLFIFIFIFICLQVIADDTIPIPDLTYRVTDLTETLYESEIISLEERL